MEFSGLVTIKNITAHQAYMGENQWYFKLRIIKIIACNKMPFNMWMDEQISRQWNTAD